MNKRFYKLVIAVILLTSGLVVNGQTINDHMFPAADAAKPYIDYTPKGFLVNGKKTFIVSAGLEYARIPHELWYDRLLKIKNAGFNCVEIYTIWNFHEEHEGKFVFSGDHDLGAFLTMVKDLGLYAIVRVGPYYCAEWDSGGYPIWLKFKKGLRVREDNKQFEYYVDHFFDHLLPIVFKNQVNKGGPVIMVQLENEHINGWGTVMPDGYFKYLQTKALGMGLQVPYFFSGLHHASDPAGDGKSDDIKRPNPWFSTEFWSVWYSQYGAKPADAGVYDRRTWKIIAHGGNGYNYYMVHGGSNFGYTNNDEDAASYDYGAAIGQAGDLRPIYYTFKRAAWFARSFQDVLENSSDATAAYPNLAADTAVKVSARTSPAGDLIFLDNQGHKPVTTKIAGTDMALTIDTGEIYPLVHNLSINTSTILDWAYTRVFAVVKQESTTTIILDAEKGTSLSLHFTIKGKALSQSAGLKINGNKADLDEKMSAGNEPLEYNFSVGSEKVRILAMNRAATDKTWIVDSGKKNYIISGVSFAGDLIVKDNTISLSTEKPLLSENKEQAILYTADQKVVLGETGLQHDKQPAQLKLGQWEQKPADLPAKTGFDSDTWLKSKLPLQMGADGDVTADAWYRTSVNVPTNGKYIIQVKGSGRAQAFIDGKPAVKWMLSDGEVSLNLRKGRHKLAIFTAHDGRDKLAAYIGPIDNADSKGIFGDALIKKGGPFISTLNNWYLAKAASKNDFTKGPPKFDTTVYKKYKIGDDAFNLKEGFGWFQTIIDHLPPGVSKLTLSFKSVDENAVVFINGKQVARHQGWNIPFEVYIIEPLVLKGRVTISVFIENYSNEGGIDQPVKINVIGNATPITGWAMKGGTNDLTPSIGWTPLTDSKKEANVPTFYHTKFSLPASKDQALIWRVAPTNLGHGSIWVNGHNLGRYPERIKIPGLYIPECWLKTGSNELVIYDEDGNRPTDVKVVAEPEAGRDKIKLTATIN